MKLRNLFLLALLPLSTGCEEILAPFEGLHVQIYGPKESYGTAVRAGYSGWEDAGYKCTFPLHLTTFGGQSQPRPSYAEWNTATVELRDNAGARIGFRVYDRNETNALLGGPLYAKQSRRAGELRVVAPSLPYRVRLTVQYFDPETRHDMEATFSARCDAPPA